MWHNHTKYNLEQKKKKKKFEVLTHATTWRNFKNIMLNESSQSQNN